MPSILTAPARAPRERRAAPSTSPSRIHALARAALGDVAGAHVLALGLGRGEAGDLAASGARVTALGVPDLRGPVRAPELPTWGFDALLASGFLSRSGDLEAALFGVRRWVRPGARLALVEPLAGASGAGLSERDLELARLHLPGIRVTRLAAPEAVRGDGWAAALVSAVEEAAPWIPQIGRGRIALLAGRMP